MNMETSRTRTPKAGDVYFMRFEGTGNEQSGMRPCVVFQNNVGNAHSPNLIVLPMTSNLKKMGMPTHALLRREESGMKLDSVVLCENPQCVSKERMGSYITHLSPDLMARISEAYLLAMSALAFIRPEALPLIRERAVRLNGTT